MTTFGVTAAGFVVKTLTDVIDQFEADGKAAFGAGIQLSSTSNWTKLFGLVGDRLSELWEVAQVLDADRSPGQATGAALADIGSITGSTPNAATPTSALMYLTGTNGTLVAAGKQISIVTTGIIMVTQADVTISTADTRSSSTSYAVGDVVSNAGSIYLCTVAGVSFTDGSQAPTFTTGTGSDGTVTWQYVGPGAAFATVQANAQETGPITAPADAITLIQTPVTGWTSATNPSSAEPGADAETDAEFRIRRIEELPGDADSTPAAVKERILKDLATAGDTGPTVIVISNRGDTFDLVGRPPHSVECVIKTTATDQQVTNSVFAHVGIGINFYGNQPNVYTDVDNENIEYTVYWSKPVNKRINVIVNVNVDAAIFPADGVSQIVDAIVKFGLTFAIGQDVVARRLGAQAFTVAGVLDTPSVPIALNPTGPTVETTLVMGYADLALFEAGDITVNVTPVSP